ncbi:MAG: serine hydroxymethyltransferase [Puniceicoccales bacterium]|jgi:glycine hydroxymethyltransferase|nr:serine hydroxymethyltransferase [Puniceicoccales bacterium]
MVADLIRQEKNRQQCGLELIASENFTLPAILEAVGSVLTNKYAEGYPGKRYYGGCEYVDQIESLAIERAKQVFGADHANVQPHSGTQANVAVYLSVLRPGDKLLTMQLDHGGHLSHGYSKNVSGMLFKVVHYGVNLQTGCIDYDHLEQLAMKEKPAMITVGASAYPRTIDFERMGKIAKQSGAYLLADIAHIAGLVAAGLHPSPVPYADFVTTTTHKTLRGPRGGLILCKGKYAQEVDAVLFPGTQGGPLMHVIAGKAVCFKEALTSTFREYQRAVIQNTHHLADAFARKGYTLVSGGTDNHLFLIDLRPSHPDLTGKKAQELLEKNKITVNRNTIPGETRSPFQASGLRIGTAALTSRGMGGEAMEAIAELMHQTLQECALLGNKKIRDNVESLCKDFPLPY